MRELKITLTLFIMLSLLCTPLYAQRRGGGYGGVTPRGVRGGSGGSFGSFITSIGAAIFEGGPDYIPAAKSHGILRIKVTPEDAEIYINDRFIGMAKDFNGPAVISAPQGDHILELKHKGSAHAADVNIILGSDTFVFYSFDSDGQD